MLNLSWLYFETLRQMLSSHSNSCKFFVMLKILCPLVVEVMYSSSKTQIQNNAFYSLRPRSTGFKIVTTRPLLENVVHLGLVLCSQTLRRTAEGLGSTAAFIGKERPRGRMTDKNKVKQPITVWFVQCHV